MEKILPYDPSVSLPVCPAGERACPPEDCGSFPGYENVLRVLQKAKTPEDLQLREWVGCYDSERFVREAVNCRLNVEPCPLSVERCPLNDRASKGRPLVFAGWRAMNRPGARVGIRLFTPLNAERTRWRESVIDDNTMACEDLCLADLNGNGRLDIVAAGRATRNLMIYFNDPATTPGPQ